MNDSNASARTGLEIAIIGMAARFPGARSIDEFWQNLREGKESISFFTEQEMEALGVGPSAYHNPGYVRAGGVLDDIDLFDAGFFGYSPREAEIIDPQQRIILECAWEALENAGHDPETYKGVIGVYAGASMSRYMRNLYSNPEVIASVGVFHIGLANDKDFLTSRVSYKLNLEGPSITIQTACSTSLVAIHLACQALLIGECDTALAGGVRAGEEAGYTFHPGGIASPDGHCRAFDAQARGTVGGNGAGIVVLKRLEDALAGGDFIHAVIKGSAINNDGALKMGYTAPRVEGQASAIRAAQTAAEVDPETVTYVEAHGTGTELGDPIEVTALTRAFRAKTEKKNFCALGSVKTNIGHLDVAAGLAGLVKTVQALKHRQIPPSLHFTEPNPKIDFTNSPFYVNATLSEWKSNGGPRRAGVSSFGMGGTNAHIVLEEAPHAAPSGPSRPWQLLALSARTESALETATDNLIGHLKQNTDLNLADVAYTLQTGRKRFSHRRVIVCNNSEDALSALETRDAGKVSTAFSDVGGRPVAFMFSGLGDHYVNMALELYRTEAAFRAEVDHCCDALTPLLGRDLRRVLYPGGERGQGAAQEQTAGGTRPRLDLRKLINAGAGRAEDAATKELNQTFLLQPAMFVIEYALARLWMSWGVRPQSMIGYSLGEYVAACLSGVFSLEDALLLVAGRAQMIHQLPPGAMLAVPMRESELAPVLGDRLSVAAINGPSMCVVAGPTDAVAKFQTELEAGGIASRRLQTTHAFHSRMMDPIAEPFMRLFEGVELNSPKIPFVSNVTGDWVKAEEATDPAYWARHMCRPVRFADGIARLWEEPDPVLLEVGPGQSLSSLTILHPVNDHSSDRVVLSSLSNPYDRQPDISSLLSALGKLWLAGAHLDWADFSAGEQRRRTQLPTYPFERQRYWVKRQELVSAASKQDESIVKLPDISDWLYIPSWKRSATPAPRKAEDGKAQASRALVFAGKDRLAEGLTERLRQTGWDVVTVEAGESFTVLGDSAYALNPARRDDYDCLLERLVELDKVPGLIVNLWNVTPGDDLPHGFERFTASQERGFYSLVFLAQALGKQAVTGSVHLCVVTNDMQDVTGQEDLCPEKATIIGPITTIPQEYPNIVCRGIDIHLPEPGTADVEALIGRLAEEVAGESSDSVIAYRGSHRWVQDFERVRPSEAGTKEPALREGGVYLIIGGLGQIGLALSEYLARRVKAKLVLVGRSPFPEREQWEEWLAGHGDEDGTAQKIRKLLALEGLGGEVLTLVADVGDERQMREVIARTFEQFGALNGVVHAAGVIGERSFRSIQGTTEVEYGWHVRPKVEGLLALESVLRDRRLDFCLLYSSLTSVLGGLGFTAYSAANLFMDAFACKHSRANSAPWISLNSDAWRFRSEEEDRRAVGGALGLGDLALTPEEGIEVFRRVLSMKHVSQVVVSTGDLQARINRWVKLESLRQGKDSEKKAVLALYARPDSGARFVAPADEIEQALVSLWQELLGFEPISTEDNFFKLGGHSLLIVQMISRVRDLFRLEIPMEAVFETPTVAGLARKVKAASAAGPAMEAPPLERVSRDGELPLSFAQQRLWFMDQLKPGNPAYNLENPVLLGGRLSVAALEQTLGEIERRHEVLRTSFPTLEGRPQQLTIPPATITLPLVDLTALPEKDKQAMARSLASEEANRAFTLSQHPLWRATLLRLGPEEHLALFTMHHVVSDAWSMHVLMGEISGIYKAYGAGQASALGELSIQYADFGVWQRQWLQGEVLEAQVAYWKKQLAGSPKLLELPTDRPRPKVQTFKGGSRSFVLTEELTAALKTLSSHQSVTLFMTLLAGFQALLHRYTGQDDIVVGSPVANRSRRETEQLIGFFINPLVLRTDLSANPTFEELLARVREVTLGAQAHQDLPFELLVEALQPERQTNYTPFFQVVFVLDHVPKERKEILLDLELTPFELETDTSPIDLHLAMADYGATIGGLFTYDSSLFDRRTIDEMVESLTLLLKGVSSDPQLPILDVPLRYRDDVNPSPGSPDNGGASGIEGSFVF